MPQNQVKETVSSSSTTSILEVATAHKGEGEGTLWHGADFLGGFPSDGLAHGHEGGVTTHIRDIGPTVPLRLAAQLVQVHLLRDLDAAGVDTEKILATLFVGQRNICRGVVQSIT